MRRIIKSLEQNLIQVTGFTILCIMSAWSSYNIVWVIEEKNLLVLKEINACNYEDRR